MLKNNYLLLVFLFITGITFAQNDCTAAITVCGNSGSEGLTVSGPGIQELDGNITCDGEESNSIWLKLNIKTSGTLGFVITPESSSIIEDFDFYIFGPNADCDNLGTSIRCSTTNPQASNQGDNLTGMNDSETDVSEGPGPDGNSFLKSLDVIAGESYFLVIDRPLGNSGFSIAWTGTAKFNDPPVLNVPTTTAINLTECDSDGTSNFSTPFKLTKNTPVIIGNQTNVAVTYYILSNDAITGTNEISDPDAFVNTENPQTIYARITDTNTGCFNFVDFTIEVTNSISIPNDTAIICDDDTDGNDANGQATFDLVNQVTPQIFDGQATTGMTIHYFATQNDADNNTSELPQFYYKKTSVSSIFIKAENNFGCSTIKEIQLKVNPLPIKKIVTLVQCDSSLNPDGLTLFNLNEASDDFLNNDTNLSVAYFENAIDLQNNQNQLNNYINTTNPQDIIAKITNNTTGCSSLSKLTLVVNINPTQNKILLSCDVQGAENGLTTFNLTQSNFTLSPTETIAYYVTSDDAFLEQNVITNINSYPNTTPYDQTIYARIEDGNNCSSINTIQLLVNKLPNIEEQSDNKYFICSNIQDDNIIIDAALISGSSSDYNFKWYLDGTVIPRDTYSIQINQTGTYTVDVIDKKTLCFKIRTIIVKPSNSAAFGDITIVDATSQFNTVTINLTLQSIGKYEYSIDNPNGPFQESNFFDNVSSGIHIVYVNDIHGCGIVSRTIAVIGFPEFFTPNGDGFNDTWKVDGVNAIFNKGTIVYIFDRFGKLVKEIATRDTAGWDGTLNGKPLPADDYWYVVHLEDGRIAKGHFALKR